MERVRMMHPELYEEAKEGDVSFLSGIHPGNRTEEKDKVMRMDPQLYQAAKEGDVWDYFLFQLSNQPGEEVSDEFFLRTTQYGNNNILHIAARAGSPGCDTFVAEALRHFPFLSNQVNSQGDTPLLVAARFGHLKVVKTLMATAVENRTNSSHGDVEEGIVDRQLDLLVTNPVQGTTALHEALRNGHEDVARYLLGLQPEMATFDSSAGESPLFLAAESRCQKFVKDILRSRWPCSTKGPHRQNVLHAARNCDGEMISELIEGKPDLMRQLDSRGKAAIHYAVEAEYWVVLDRMLKADPSIVLFPDADGYTPLLRAASRGYLKICRDILEKCPESIEARNYQGRNALHLFKLRKRSDRKKLFKIPEIRELLNIGDDDGNTPLHLALMGHHYDKAMVLIARQDIDLGAVNNKGLTALDLCQPKWNLLNTQPQGLIYLLLRRQQAPHGRLANDQEVPDGGPDLNQFLNTMTLVATILATVTFAAIFTMPGGFDTSPDNLGVAVLVKKASLKVFILADSIALCCSMAVMVLLMWVMIAEKDDVMELANISSLLLQFAFLATLVAFMSGIFAVTASKALWVPILVCIFGFFVPIFSSPLILLLARICMLLWKVPEVFL